MKTKLKILFTGYIALLFVGIISCEDDSDLKENCLFSANSFIWKTLKVSFEKGDFDNTVKISEISDNSVKYDEFAIQLTYTFESNCSLTPKMNSFNFISSAYAESIIPSKPLTDNIIRNIQILPNKDFNADYPKGSNLADLFDVIIMDPPEVMSNPRIDLNSYLSIKPYVPQILILILKEAPEETKEFQFTIEYSQRGQKLNYVEFTTQPIEIRTE